MLALSDGEDDAGDKGSDDDEDQVCFSWVFFWVSLSAWHCVCVWGGGGGGGEVSIKLQV